MKTSDKLKQYVVLHQALVQEKAQLEQRLAQIDRALGVSGSQKSAISISGAKPSRAGKRADNSMSLKEAVVRVTRGNPKTKKDILKGIHKLGYRFAAKNPMNSLNVLLYTKGLFKNDDGKFSPTK
jgi:hypothetical protein